MDLHIYYKKMIKKISLAAWIMLVMFSCNIYGQDDPNNDYEEYEEYEEEEEEEESKTEGVMVVEIEVLNTVTTTPEQIRYRMSTRVGHPLSENTLDGDFQRLSEMGVFEDIQIKKELASGGVKIIVVVREKDVIRRIEFRGNKQVKERKLRTLVQSKVGERFDAGKANRDKRAIQDFYQKEFYYFVEVEVVAEPFEDGVRVVFDINEGGRMYVADIEFRGNTVFKRKELLALMQTKRTGLITRGKYIRRQFERDLERIRLAYLDKGYLDVKVIERPFEITTNTPASKWQRRDAYIHIDIEEGEQYKIGIINFNFLTTSLVPEEKIRATIKSIPGGIYSPKIVQEDANKIRDVYGLYPNSRYFTRVMPDPEITEDGPIMDLTFNIQEGEEVTVEGIRITGLTSTKEVVVLREFELYPGQKIDSRAFNRSKENIENLGYFKENPVIEVREGSAPDRAILVAELEEINTGKLTAGAGYSSKDSFLVSTGLTQRNFDFTDTPKSFKDFYTGKAFKGAGQYFSINLSKGAKTESYGASFTNPWIFGKPISMSIDAGFNNSKYDEYHERRMSATLGFGKRLFNLRQLTASVAYRLEYVRLGHFANWVDDEIKSEKGRHNVSRWILSVAWDSRDSHFEPTKGALISATGELAGKASGASRSFVRGMLAAQYFLPFYEDQLERRWTLGLRADIGYADAYGKNKEVPFYERYYAGGIGSIRGYEDRGISPRGSNGVERVGGEGMMTAAAEVFFPIYDKMIRGSTFYDVGTVWRYWNKPKGYLGSNGEKIGKRQFRGSYGFGLHIKTPLGPMPVRLYYAFPQMKRDKDETQRFQFSMGALF